MPLNRKALGLFQGQMPDGRLVGGQSSTGIEIAGALATDQARTQDRHQAYKDGTYQVPYAMGLPSQMWDGFFGALNNRSRLVESAGGQMRVNTLGRPGSGTGFGRWKQRDEAGTGISRDLMTGLSRAIRR